VNDDTISRIRHEDLKKRICTRSEAEKSFDILLSGTSATLVIQTPKKLHLGWIGDSNVALWSLKDKSQGGSKNLFLNDPAHKPSVQSERIRIYNNRGEIRETSDGLQRIFLRARMYPGLKISRTIGDLIPHQIGVCSEPQVSNIDLNLQFDKFFVMGTYGLWEFLSPEDLIELINDMPLSQRETQGQISSTVMQKVKDLCNQDNGTLQDTTFLISNLINLA
jgi:serine/threonine protein phosphatase PrpC